MHSGVAVFTPVFTPCVLNDPGLCGVLPAYDTYQVKPHVVHAERLIYSAGVEEKNPRKASSL